MEYTKGEWKAETLGWIDELFYMPIECNGGVVVTVDNENRNVAEANAHLIAAAPDLYEALKAWVAWAIEDEKTRVMPMGQSDKALAKAKGK